jgi:hypothetical protein
VRATGEDGAPVAGVAISFEVNGGGGKIARSAVAAGSAKTHLERKDPTLLQRITPEVARLAQRRVRLEETARRKQLL